MSLAPTIADGVKTAVEGASAFTLYGGYATHQLSGHTVRFPVGVQQAERRNVNGRVTYAKYVYADGSTLEYHYHGDTYSITTTRAPVP